MALNAHFWRQYFGTEFVPQINALVTALEARVLPGFSGIEEESKQISSDAWTRFMEMPATGDEDPSEFAEAAEQAGVSHYLLLTGVRQGMLNLFAAAIHHAFEQQLMLFHRQEVLRSEEQNDIALISMSQFCFRLREHGIDLESFQSWLTIEELRLVANVVKHAEGRSTKALHALRPDMFESPYTKDLKFMPSRSPQVFQPLFGEDLYVSVEDIKVYQANVLQFWQELSEAMLNA